jgi:hypothetical protein
VLRNRFETNRNKKSAFQNKPTLKINTLLSNGHGRGHGHGHVYGHGHGHFSFISVCFEWSLGVRLYRNIETSCFYIKAKQPKLTSCFG